MSLRTLFLSCLCLCAAPSLCLYLIDSIRFLCYPRSLYVDAHVHDLVSVQVCQVCTCVCVCVFGFPTTSHLKAFECIWRHLRTAALPSFEFMSVALSHFLLSEHSELSDTSTTPRQDRQGMSISLFPESALHSTHSKGLDPWYPWYWEIDQPRCIRFICSGSVGMGPIGCIAVVGSIP